LAPPTITLSGGGTPPSDLTIDTSTTAAGQKRRSKSRWAAFGSGGVGYFNDLAFSTGARRRLGGSVTLRGDIRLDERPATLPA